MQAGLAGPGGGDAGPSSSCPLLPLQTPSRPVQNAGSALLSALCYAAVRCTLAQELPDPAPTPEGTPLPTTAAGAGGAAATAPVRVAARAVGVGRAEEWVDKEGSEQPAPRWAAPACLQDSCMQLAVHSHGAWEVTGLAGLDPGCCISRGTSASARHPAARGGALPWLTLIPRGRPLSLASPP